MTLPSFNQHLYLPSCHFNIWFNLILCYIKESNCQNHVSGMQVTCFYPIIRKLKVICQIFNQRFHNRYQYSNSSESCNSFSTNATETLTHILLPFPTSSDHGNNKLICSPVGIDIMEGNNRVYTTCLSSQSSADH